MSGLRAWRPGDPIAALREVLDRGGVLAIPTESSYGLGVDPRNGAGVEAVYRLKARERGKPLPVVVAEAGQVALLGADPGGPEVALVAPHWPAPLTVVLPLPPASRLPAAAGGASVAVRVPAHDGLRALLAELGPLTATSANPAGEPPALDVDALRSLSRPDVELVVVDGGRLPGGPPSTLVALAADGRASVLRQGAFPVERLFPDAAPCPGGAGPRPRGGGAEG